MLSTVDTDIKGHKLIPDVPAAQFDWNSSGLINPLDGKLKTVKLMKQMNKKIRQNKIIRWI